MIKIKDIEKVNSLYKEVKELDAEIIAIEKLAILASKADLRSSLTINYVDLTPKEEPKKNIFDSDGFIKREFTTDYENPTAPHQYVTMSIEEAMRRSFENFTGLRNRTTEISSGVSGHLNIKIKESTILIILEQLMFEKKKQRTQIIQTLKQLGVTF